MDNESSLTVRMRKQQQELETYLRPARIRPEHIAPARQCIKEIMACANQIDRLIVEPLTTTHAKR